MDEVAPGIFPTQVDSSSVPLTSTTTVKVLGVPPEASSQTLHEAMVHYGDIRSVRLAPTQSGSGFVGYVVYVSALSGKSALDASYGFLGKDRIRIIHPAMTKEVEGNSGRMQL